MLAVTTFLCALLPTTGSMTRRFGSGALFGSPMANHFRSGSLTDSVGTSLDRWFLMRIHIGGCPPPPCCESAISLVRSATKSLDKWSSSHLPTLIASEPSSGSRLSLSIRTPKSTLEAPVYIIRACEVTTVNVSYAPRSVWAPGHSRLAKSTLVGLGIDEGQCL